eukprot:TRINITY_DN37071_c1_g1_i1.p1 TRINITY_DN37071_c1_g1~~TRINITY_DN37071_c1_g1_i1.p1  ORF type:complete len:168 (+),score=32.64 TRINITY_DN37071_c1_g1_i1:58-561(+)
MSPGLVRVPFLARCFMISIFVRVGSVSTAGNETAAATQAEAVAAPHSGKSRPSKDAGALLISDMTPSEPLWPPGELLNFQSVLAGALHEPGTPVVAAVHMGQRILAIVLLLFLLFIAGPRICCGGRGTRKQPDPLDYVFKAQQLQTLRSAGCQDEQTEAWTWFAVVS